MSTPMPSVFSEAAQAQTPAEQTLSPELMQQLQKQLQQGGATPPQAAELRDIHLPEAVSWFPPALGWWLLFILIVLACGALYKYLRRAKPEETAPAINWRPMLQQELNHIKTQYRAQSDAQQLAIDLSALLRMAIIKERPAFAPVAGQTGEAWLNTLDEHFKTEGRFKLSASALIRAPYNPNIQFDADALLSLVENALQQNSSLEGEHVGV